MFPALLGGSLVSGACLLAAASFTGGTLVAAQTAAQLVGWLLVLSPLLAFVRMRRSLAELGVAAIALSTGTAVLYVSYFEWSAADPQGPMTAHAAPRVAPQLPAAEPRRPVAIRLPVEAPQPPRKAVPKPEPEPEPAQETPPTAVFPNSPPY